MLQFPSWKELEQWLAPTAESIRTTSAVLLYHFSEHQYPPNSPTRTPVVPFYSSVSAFLREMGKYV